MRKLIYGIGINDSDYAVESSVNGERFICPYFRRWRNMIERCYSAKYHEKHPTYRGCSVATEWLCFSNFRAWMGKQNWQNMDLDKDIIKPGNKIYSAENCRFITQSLNTLLSDSLAIRGLLPQGVSWHKPKRKYVANVRINGKKKYLGYFSTTEAAFAAYIKAKTSLILQAAQEQADPLIASGLRLHAQLLNQ